MIVITPTQVLLPNRGAENDSQSTLPYFVYNLACTINHLAINGVRQFLESETFKSKKTSQGGLQLGSKDGERNWG